MFIFLVLCSKKNIRLHNLQGSVRVVCFQTDCPDVNTDKATHVFKNIFSKASKITPTKVFFSPCFFEYLCI